MRDVGRVDHTWALVAALLTGCACGVPGTPDDAGLLAPDAPRVDGGGVLPGIDGGSFGVPDAPLSTAPACARVDRTSTSMPPLEPGQVLVAAHGDRILLVERPSSPPGPGTLFRFYESVAGEPFALIGEHAFDRAVGLTLAARFDDGAWDVLVELFSHEGLAAWLRLEEDGVVVTERRGPVDVRIEARASLVAGEGFVLLSFEPDGPGIPWIVTIGPDGAEAWSSMPMPPEGSGYAWQLVADPDGDAVTLLATHRAGRLPPQALTVPIAPLMAPERASWRSFGETWPMGSAVRTSLHDTDGGMVLAEFVRLPGEESFSLHLSWLDEALGITARYAVETTTEGHVSITGAPPAQEILLTLPDTADDLAGAATVFHARARAPGVVSALTPIGRARGYAPPTTYEGPDGRTHTLHIDDRVDVERLCEAP